ncbi:NAD(P)-dependent oxidoreductase [Mesorhizobium sp.]|uniref:NAD(P)-dependent oxidoreductase n=1 Tax=Mesorhizobium sp. TaxID=1871066 RepID=UPI00257B6B60|nr:NAD(P)-dependent oxidoreductase [Mesorhizobium sp.]
MLQGRSVGVIGLGSIGGRVAKYAKAFDMNVLGVRRNKEHSAEGVDKMYGPDELHAVLAQCDYIVVAMPNTKKIRADFSEKQSLLR